jgi:hypothetical protein
MAGYTYSMTTTEIPGYTESATINHNGQIIGEFTLDVIEGDSATLDVALSLSGTVELNAAIEALIALRDMMAQAEQFRGAV